MPSHHPRIPATVGNAPIVRFNKLAPPHVNLFARLEAFHPMGSVMYRLAPGILADAERRGALKPGQTVIEAFDAFKAGALQALRKEHGVGFDGSVAVDPYALLPGWLQRRSRSRRPALSIANQ